MAGFNDHEAGDEAGNKSDVSVKHAHALARAFDYTEEVESPFMETEIVNLDDETEEFDIHNFVGDLRALMVDDSDDEVVLDSEDDMISEQKDREVRGCLWRRVAKSFEVMSSAGSNLTSKVIDNASNSVHADTPSYQEVPIGISSEKTLVSDNENVAQVNESQEPGESTQANALRFVDHYLSISVENSSPEIKIRKTNGLRSPFSSFAKGSHDLAKKANLVDRIGTSTFEWDDNRPEYGLDFILEKKTNTVDQQFEEELPRCPSGNDIVDVGFNTQMAAETIQSLLYANENEDMNKKTLQQLNVETPTRNLKNSRDKSFKPVTKKKQKQLPQKENVPFLYRKRGSCSETQKVKTFSPVASRTRRGSLVKTSKRTESSSNLEHITHAKQINTLHERKPVDLDTTVFGSLKFDTWNWPKMKRTCRNMRQNATLTDNRIPVVGPSKTDGNFREAFLMSSVKKKARTASRFKSTDGNKSVKNEVTRLRFTESFPDFTSKDLRKPRNKVEFRVLFSQNLDDDVVNMQRKIMEKLGVSLAKDCLDATHFVADRFARTQEMLEAMACGKPVVTPLWLESCDQATCIIDESKYTLRDAKREKELGFNMIGSLARARSHPLLKDQRVFITPNVEPDKEMIKHLIIACQGQVIESVQQANIECKISNNLLILSCEKDYEVCVPLLDTGAAVYSSELLLNGIIIQKLDQSRHQLFSGHVKMKRYTRKRLRNGNQGIHIHGS